MAPPGAHQCALSHIDDVTRQQRKRSCPRREAYDWYLAICDIGMRKISLSYFQFFLFTARPGFRQAEMDGPRTRSIALQVTGTN